MKRILFVLAGLLVLQNTMAQSWKKDAKDFIVEPDAGDNLLQFSIPQSSDNSGARYMTYSQGKSNLTMEYTVDDSPEITVNNSVADGKMNLVKYSRDITDKDITGSSDYTISNKKVTDKIKTLNGYKMIMITYDYKHVISGQNITETGKVVLYNILVMGTSIINSDEHPIIVRLAFDYQQNGGPSLENLGTEILATIKKAE
jgi:hypothetical protein